MYVIFWVLLSVAHSLYNLYIFIQQQCKWLMLTIEQRGYLNKLYYNYSLVTSSNHLIETSKIPRHLAILLGQEEISILDFIRLVSWCIVAEIPYVSFYDHKGNLQKNVDLIRKKLDELDPVITQNVEWSNSLNSTINAMTSAEVDKSKINTVCTNIIHANATEVVNKYKTKIQILSYVDGKDKIVTLTKNLAKIIHCNGLQELNITSELVDEKLNLNVRVPDPDLAIVFGKTMCTYGFLPWQTRVTEFFNIPSHHDISSNDLIDTLHKFSECQQRYGK